MSQQYIKQKAAATLQQFQTRDPEQIAKGLDIGIRYADIGTLKGFYTVMLDNPFIVINQALPEAEQRVVLAHELGHHLLHEHLVQTDGIRETVLYDISSKPEYEANLFAAHLLLESEQIEQLAKQGATLAQMAAAMNVDEHLIRIFLKTTQE